MTGDGHHEAAEELRRSMASLLPPEHHIRIYVEAALGRAVHLLCLGSERRFGVHRDNHDGMSRWLRERDEGHMADSLAELETIRTGRWYGKQGNGDTATRVDEILGQIEAWAVAK